MRGGGGGGGVGSIPQILIVAEKSDSLPKFQTLVYDILPPTTATVDYAIGLEKLSANEQFFDSAQNGSKFVTDNSNHIRRFFYNWPRCLPQRK